MIDLDILNKIPLQISKDNIIYTLRITNSRYNKNEYTVAYKSELSTLAEYTSDNKVFAVYQVLIQLLQSGGIDLDRGVKLRASDYEQTLVYLENIIEHGTKAVTNN